MATRAQIDTIVEKIVSYSCPKKIILFGSHAYGRPTADSDIDLFVIAESALPRYQRVRDLKKCLRGSKEAVDLLVYTPLEIEEWKDVKTAFITTVMEKGVVLYG
jgi:uncharacterized protein